MHTIKYKSNKQINAYILTYFGRVKLLRGPNLIALKRLVQYTNGLEENSAQGKTKIIPHVNIIGFKN